MDYPISEKYNGIDNFTLRGSRYQEALYECTANSATLLTMRAAHSIVARSHTGGGPERTLQIFSPPATASRLLSVHGLASPSHHPPATLCRLGYAAAPRAALLAGALTAHSNPLCRVSRPSPRQVFRFGAVCSLDGRLAARGAQLYSDVFCRIPTRSRNTRGIHSGYIRIHPDTI